MRKNDHKQNRKRQNSQSASQKLPPLTKKTPVNEKSKSLGNITYQDEGIVVLLYEYFIKNNFLATLDEFQKEYNEKGFKPNSKFVESFKQEMIESFEQGNREHFFIRFTQFVPISMRQKQIQTMKLQFYIQVYFFVYSFHPQLGKKRNIDNSAKNAFINYLEGRGATLAKSPQFLQFYALANLPKPQDHPSFKTIFTKEWISQLKKKVIYFIQKFYPSNKTPALVSIYDKFIDKNLDKNMEQSITDAEDELPIEQQIQIEESRMVGTVGNQKNSRAAENPHYQSLKSQSAPFETTDRERESLTLKIAELDEEKNELVKFIENVKNKYQSLQNNYKDFTDAAQTTLIESQSKWFKITQQFYNIASNLLQVCHAYEKGIPLQDPGIVTKIGNKLNKYESFINMNLEDLTSQNVDFSLFERADQDISTDIARKNSEYRSQNLIQLDFEKVKKALARPQPEYENEKCYLLQALKWRLTKTRGAVLKRQVFLSMVMNDVFNFESGSQTINILLGCPNKSVLLRTIQVINALCKDYYGRNYLCEQNLLRKTIQVLKNEETEENIKIIIISTLQHLSIRKLAQKQMIKGDLLKWITNKLHRQRETMSSYLMQYSTALLINLLLKKEGSKKSEQIKEQLLTTLINLMEVEAVQIRSYVHGALYPLFSKRVFRELAKEYGLGQNIKFLIENTTSESLVHQLKYLDQQLVKEDTDDAEQNDEDDEDDEDEDMDEICDEEVGEDLQIDIDIESGGLSGEELLMKQFSLTGPEAIKQLNLIREEVENTLKKKSIYMEHSFSERPGTNNQMIGGLMNRNASNNNSIYSNKSSNRILRSELNNRSQNKTNVREKLDTVQPDNSEKQMSIRDFIEENNEESLKFRKNASQKASRAIEESEVFPGVENNNNLRINANVPQTLLENESFSQQPTRPVQPYETTEEYRNAFGTRARIIRTPPEK